jgi:hypothetical protein
MSVPTGWRAAAATISSKPVMPNSLAAWSQSLPGWVTRALSRSPERAGVRLEEDVQDLLARVGQSAEDLGPVGHDADVLRVIHDRVPEPAVQLLRQRRLPRRRIRR